MIAKYLSMITLVIGIGLGGAGGAFLTKWITPKPAKCPDLVCPNVTCPPTLGSEFDKIKSKNVTLNLNQNYQVHADGDSLLLAMFEEAVEKKLLTLKVSRCR